MAKNPRVFESASNLYTATGVVGTGGNACVFSATDDSGSVWAVKVLDPAAATREKRRRFKNEIAFSVRNQHANIVTVVDHGVTTERGESAPFYVMRLYASSLKRLLKTPLDPARVLPLFIQMLHGTEAAHLQNVWHRDLKPANILADAEATTAVVADFGIARFAEDQMATLIETEPGDRLANFEYAAPEQRRPGGIVDHRADIFALGLILYEMFMGEVPHGTGVTPIGSKHSGYAYLDELVEKMRAQLPEQRPQSIADVKRQLTSLANIEVAAQKLSKLHARVVPASTADDPLIVNPPSIEQIDYRDGRLFFVFNAPITPLWFATFKRINWGVAPGGKSPEAFSYLSNAISIRVDHERDVKVAVDHARRWISIANKDYRHMVEREQRERDEEARRAIQASRDAEQRRIRMLRAIEDVG